MVSASASIAATEQELREMDATYRRGGLEQMMAPHVVYAEPQCPHPDCKHRLQAIDFRLEQYGPAIHDPLVRAWWQDVGFVGRCPACQGWIHFCIQSKTCATEEQARGLPRLPNDWQQVALIL